MPKRPERLSTQKQILAARGDTLCRVEDPARPASLAWTIIARRALAINPARLKARPFGLRGLTAQRGQARGLSCQEWREAASRPPDAVLVEGELVIVARLKKTVDLEELI